MPAQHPIHPSPDARHTAARHRRPASSSDLQTYWRTAAAWQRWSTLIGLTALLAAVLTASGASSASAAPNQPLAPAVSVTTVASGLSYPWDLSFTPDGAMLYDERPGRLWVRTAGGTTRQLHADLSDVFVALESGLEGLVVDPDFATNRQFYTCQAYKGTGSTPIDIRVIRWRVDAGYTTATRVGDPVVTGLPITSGRHGGCRLRFAPDGTLHIGTGDAATGTNPQNLQSLGGKTLRVNPDGTIPTSNPFYAMGGNARYVYTYGHRNVQGMALRPGTNQMWTVEHGTSRDDEVNLEQAGGNYGWDPIPVPPATTPQYNEARPMTDLTKFPNAISARWSSGYPTVAPSGGTFLTGTAWGRWQGALAVGILKDTGVMVLSLDPAGKVVRVERIAALQQGYGRIRAAQLGPDHSLYLTTSNGSDDKILKVTPRAPAPVTYRPGLDVSPVAPAAAQLPDGSLGLVVRGSNKRPYALLTAGSGTGTWHALPGSSTTSSPAVVSLGAGKLDAFAVQQSTRSMLHWAYRNGRWQSPQDLGGILTTAPAAVSLDGSTIDVLARGRDYALWRYTVGGGGSWSKVGGELTSAPGAAADVAGHRIIVRVRGGSGVAYEAVLSATGITQGFRSTGDRLYSAQSVTVASGTVSTADTSYDGAPVLRTGAFVDALAGQLTSAPAITSTSGHGPVLVGRGTNGQVYACGLASGHCAFYSLGGQVS